MFYRVEWEMELDADSPRQAAARAQVIQRMEDSIATVFDIYGEDGEVTRVDLAEEPPRVHHDAHGWYIVKPYEEEPEDGHSLGFDGRAHYASRGEAERNS